MQDMPEELRAEFDALLETRRRHETLLSILPGMVYRGRNDPDWTMEFVSEGCWALTGFKPEEIIGNSLHSFAEVIHPDDREAVWNGVQEALRERRPFQLTYRIVTAGGEEKWVWERGRGVFDGDGEVEALEGFIVDITWHRRTEDALSRSETRYRALFEHMLHPFIVVRPDRDEHGAIVDFTLLEVNTAWEALTGLHQSQVQGRRVSQVLPDTENDWLDRFRHVVTDGHSARFEQEAAFMRKWFAVHAFPTGDGNLAAVMEDITAHRQAREALRDSERRYRTLAETAHDSIFIIGRDDTVQYVNTHGAALLGSSADEVIGQSRDQFFGVEVGRRQGENLRRVFETGEPLRVEMHTTVAQGDELWLETHLTPLKDDEGRVTAVMGVARDVTQRRRTQEALRDSERRYRTLAETAQDLIFIVGPDDVVQYVNTHGAATLGLRVEEVIGRRHSEFVPADVARRQCDNQRRVFETGEPLRVAAAVPVAGHEMWLETHLTPLKDDEGRVTAVMGVARDVTQRRRTQEALRDSERRYRTLAETAQDFIFIIGPDDVVQYVNTHGAAVFGLKPEDIIGRPRATLFPAEVNRRQGENLRHVFETGEPLREETRTPFERGDVWLETHLTPLWDDDGQVTAVLGVARDTTERRRAEEAQRLATVGQLAAGVAHEFNNLLASMSLAAELSLGDGTPHDHRRLAEVVLQATDRGASICKNLTAFARPRRPRRQATTLERAIEAALVLTEPQLAGAGIQVQREYNAGGRDILADPRQIEQVFVNLIINACQAMPGGGGLRVTVGHVPEADGLGHVQATVTDTGTGIAPEHLPRIFDPFFTTRRGTHSDGSTRTGLGLSVSRSIVAANDGTITVASESGNGTTFEVRFPVSIGEAPQAAAAVPEAAAAPAPAADGLRVLVAEDAASLRELLVEGLGAKGFSIAPMQNAEQAISALGQAHFDVVITDLTMPAGGGREVLAAARSLPDPPPVIIITGKIEEHLAEQLLQQGACVCLRKPFRLDALLEAIAQCIEREGKDGNHSQAPDRT